MTFDAIKGLGETLSLIRELSNECAVLGGPLSKGLNTLIQAGAYREVVESDLKPQAANDDEVTDYLYARQIKGLVEKQGFLDLGWDRRLEAFDKFVMAEELCRETNERLWTTLPKWDVGGVLYTAQRIIASILGPVPSYAELPDRKSVV